MNDSDIRWRQRFSNFEKAFGKFSLALAAHSREPENELYQMALVQSFEFVFELGWKVVKDYLVYAGIPKVSLPRDVIKHGFQHNIIENGQMWIDMLEDRNLMSHTYSEENARNAVTKIRQEYVKGIQQVHDFFIKKIGES